MDDIAQEQLQKAYSSLPQTLRDTITDPATYAKIEAIAAQHGLTRVETGLLAQITSALLMGTLKPAGFVPALIDYLSLSQEDAAPIAQEVNRDIFNPVKDVLKGLHGIGSENTSASLPNSRVVSTAVLQPPLITPSPYAPQRANAGMPPPSAKPAVPALPPLPPAPPTLPTPASLAAPILPPPAPIPPPLQKPVAPVLPNIFSTERIGQATAAKAEPVVTNIFEEKLGNAFRMKSESVTRIDDVPAIVPALEKPAAPPAPLAPATPLPGTNDPYRETL